MFKKNSIVKWCGMKVKILDKVNLKEYRNNKQQPRYKVQDASMLRWNLKPFSPPFWVWEDELN